MLRNIVGISIKDRVPNNELMKMTAFTDIAQAVAKSKWSWGGHIARMKDDRWTYKATMWDPRTGKRHRGRPRRRWADTFREQAGHQWTRAARRREEWKILGRDIQL